MTTPALPDFDVPQLALAVENLPDALIDELPFGAIRVDADGVVVRYSLSEARLSGRGARSAVGLKLFVDIAPCFDNPQFLGRIERASKAGTLDLEFGYIGDFDDPDKALRVRVQSDRRGGYWIFTQRS